MAQSQRKILQTLMLNPAETFEARLVCEIAKVEIINGGKSTPIAHPIPLGNDIDGNSIEATQYLGGGCYGNVFLARWKARDIVIKQINVKKTTESKALSEVALMQLFTEKNAPNIVTYYFSNTESPDYFYVGMEYMNRMSMRHAVQRYPEMKMTFIHSIIGGCATGLDFMHTHDFQHNDIKSENVVLDLSPARYFTAKLADFGHSCHKDDPALATGSRGSPLWMAPEVISRIAKNSLASDMFSFGIFVWEAVDWTGAIPYSHIDPVPRTIPALEEVLWDKSQEIERQPFPANTPAIEKKIMIGCWAHDTQRRMKITEVMSLLFPKRNMLAPQKSQECESREKLEVIKVGSPK